MDATNGVGGGAVWGCDSVMIVAGSSSIIWAYATVLMIGLGLILVVDLRFLLFAWRCPIGVANDTGNICVVVLL